MPSIALFSEYYLPHTGGIELHVHTLAQQLQRAGAGVTVITAFPGPDEVEGVPVRRLKLPLIWPWRVVYTPLGIDPFVRLLRSGEFDVLHCHHSIYNPAVGAAVYLGKSVGLPTIVTFHSVLEGYARAYRAFDRIAHWTRWPVTWTAVSERVAAYFKPLLGDRIEPLHVGYDAGFWSPLPRADAAEFRVVSTMRLVPRKRPRALIEILSAVRDCLPEGMRLRARIIGQGVEYAAVERLIEQHKLGDFVQLLGRMSQDRIREAYADSDAFVLATPEESFGMAALEARAAGLPVVTLRQSGTAEFIEHERDGLLADDDAGIAAALVRLAIDPELRMRITEHNRAKPPAYRWEDVTRQHLALYERVLRRDHDSALPCPPA